jgi:hypothetical protein
MNLDSAKAHMDAATRSAREQIELNKLSLDNKLEAADREVLRKAANTMLELAPALAADPT